MNNLQTTDDIVIDIQGVGFIIYSEHAVREIKEGEDYLSSKFEIPSHVESQAIEGKIVGVSTGSPGIYVFKLFEGYPEEDDMLRYKYKLRLGIKVSDSVLFIRDLYDLMEWEPICPNSQRVNLSDGFYHITLLSNPPESQIIGDNQLILAYFKKLESMPKLKYKGVPTLC